MSEPNDADGRPDNGAPPRYARRLSDKVLGAFHHACDHGDYEVAQMLLRVVETLLERRGAYTPANRRKNVEGLVAAHERLWHLRKGR